MYVPQQFREERQNVLIDAIRSIQFGAIVLTGGAGLEVVHLPMIVRKTGDAVVLEGHVARGNPIWKTAGGGITALAIFQGPQAYVHPGWFETKRASGKAVPTWNYVVVHAHGRLSIECDPGWLRNHVTELTAVNEVGRAEPWAVSDAPDAYLDGMLQAIVGLRQTVATIEGAWKMMQHHPNANRSGTISGLLEEENAGAKAVARIMADRRMPEGSDL